MTKISKPADTSASLSPSISERFSPRIYDTQHVISEDEIASLGEAFRWAPSSNNQQPWRVAFLRRGSELFDSVSNRGLTGFNQSWAPAASLYAVVLAHKFHEDKPRNQAATYFDLGLAAQQMVLQAESMGLRSHYMGGIVHDEISTILGADEFWVVCVIAIGMQGELESGTAETIEREQLKRTRKDSTAVYSVDSKLN